MTKKLCLALSAVLLLTSGLLANGLNLNGFGARAAAMGGAFVGLADDYTAVYWNPAGLAMMKRGTFGLTGDLLIPKSDYTLDSFSMKTTTRVYPAGLVGYFRPIGDRIVVGVGAYTLSGLGAEWDNTGLEAALVAPLPTSFFTPPVEAYKWRSFIGAITIAPAIAVKVTDQFFLGATLNINYGFFRTEQWGETQVISTAPLVVFNFGQAKLNVDGWGFGATFGMLYKPTDWLSVGASYRLASKLKLDGTSTLQNLPLLITTLPDTSHAKLEATNPMWLAGGLAVKPMKNLTFTFDLQWTKWSTVKALTVKLLDPGWNAAGISENVLTLNWVSQIQIRAGLEYVMGNLALRAGFYRDPHPAPDSTMNILIPSFTYNAICAGIGYRMGGLRLDLGLEYLMGRDRTIAAAPNNMPGVYDMNILVPMISFSTGW